MFCVYSSHQLLRNKTPGEENSSSHRPKTPLAPENNIGLEKQASNSQKEILTWDENKTQTDGSPKTKGRDYKISQEVEEGRLVPPGIQIGSAGH